MSTADTISIKQQEDLSPVSVRGLHLALTREKERGIKTKMRVKLAVKMLVIAWTLMKRKEVFDPAYLNTD